MDDGQKTETAKGAKTRKTNRIRAAVQVNLRIACRMARLEKLDTPDKPAVALTPILLF